MVLPILEQGDFLIILKVCLKVLGDDSYGFGPLDVKEYFFIELKISTRVTYHALLRSVKVIIEKMRVSFQPSECGKHAVRVAPQERLSPQTVMILQICGPIIHLIEDLVLHHIGVQRQELCVLEEVEVPEHLLSLSEHFI